MLGAMSQFGLKGFTSLHFTSLHFTSLHFTSLHFTSLHFTSLHFTSLHFTSLHFTSLHFTSLHFTSLHFTSLHFTSLHFTLQCTTNCEDSKHFFICMLFTSIAKATLTNTSFHLLARTVCIFICSSVCHPF